MGARKYRWLVVSLAFGIGFWLLGWLIPDGPWHMAVKGCAVAALAVFAFERANSVSRPIAMVMVFGALGDVLIEIDLEIGALAFLCGHCFACWFYVTNRRRLRWVDAPVGAALLIGIPALTALLLPERTGVLAYACGLAAMTVGAWISRFRRDRVAVGAVLFAVSDLLLFAHLGPLAGSVVPGLLVWPLYYFGQVLIVDGVVNRPQLMITASRASRVSGRVAIATESGRAP